MNLVLISFASAAVCSIFTFLGFLLGKKYGYRKGLYHSYKHLGFIRDTICSKSGFSQEADFQ